MNYLLKMTNPSSLIIGLSWSEGSISVSKIGDRTNSSSSETDGQALAFGFDTKLNDNDLIRFCYSVR